jgi:D-alanyl-D-alanine dipeptidase
MHRFAPTVVETRLAARAPRWSALSCALLWAACMGSPQAAVADPHLAHANVPRIAACGGAVAARAALQRVAHALEAQGLELQASCAAAGSGWVVQVLVIDGFKASKIVRGPLADGHEVDMGTPAGVALAGAEPDAQGFSPDVQFNRQWLRATMARHQFDNAADAWWRFAQRGQGAAPGAETDLAAR